MPICLCGCGRKFDTGRSGRRFYDGYKCAYIYRRNQAIAGELPVKAEHACPVCKNTVQEFDNLPHAIACQPWLYADDPVRSQCSRIYRRMQQLKTKETEQVIKSTRKCPPNRRTHCFRVAPGDWKRTECAQYHATCGEGCYRKTGDCFKWPEAENMELSEPQRALIEMGVMA